MLNNVIIQGKITSRGVEILQTASGSSIAKFSINYSEKYKDEWKNSFFECVCFGATAELVAKHFDGGRAITLEGKLQQDQWEQDDGTKRSKVVIIVNRIHFPQRDSVDADAPQVKTNPGDDVAF